MRNFSFNCLILSTKISGENNRSVCAFSEDEGIFYTTLYGGPKSKMKSYVSPFNRGKIWIYKDETKNQSKITDFDVEKYHTTFSQSLFKTQLASFACEIVMKTSCAASPKNAFYLLNGFLDGLDILGNEEKDENEGRLAFIRFLWRYFELLGIKPDISHCSKCGKNLFEIKNFNGQTEENNVYLNYTDYNKLTAMFSKTENGLVCEECFDFASENYIDKNSLVFCRHSLIYLEAVSTFSPKEVRKIPVTEESFLQMKNLCLYLLDNALGLKTLKTIVTFGDIL